MGGGHNGLVRLDEMNPKSVIRNPLIDREFVTEISNSNPSDSADQQRPTRSRRLRTRSGRWGLWGWVRQDVICGGTERAEAGPSEPPQAEVNCVGRVLKLHRDHDLRIPWSKSPSSRSETGSFIEEPLGQDFIEKEVDVLPSTGRHPPTEPVLRKLEGDGVFRQSRLPTSL